MSSQEGVETCGDGKVKRLEDFTKVIGSKYDCQNQASMGYFLKDKSDGETEMNEKSKDLKPEGAFLNEENSEVAIEERIEKIEESIACDLQTMNDHGMIEESEF